MKIDTGMGVVILAVLVFYLRLIVLQRERIKQNKRAAEAASTKNKGKKSAQLVATRYSIISPKKSDRVIGIIGAVLIILGVLFYAKIIPPELLQSYWWALTAIGIVAFSWLFRL
jgi:hypothetical protein